MSVPPQVISTSSGCAAIVRISTSMFWYLSLYRPRFEPPQECFLVQMVLERLPPVDEHHGNFLVKLRVRSTVFENVCFAKFERLHGAQSVELCFDHVAQAATGLGEQYDFHHLVSQDSKSKGGGASRWVVSPFEFAAASLPRQMAA